MLVTIHPALLRCDPINTHFTGKSKSHGGLFLFINSFHFLLFIIFCLLGTLNGPTHTPGVHPCIKNPLWNWEWDQFNDIGSWCVLRFPLTPFSQKSVLRCRLHETPGPVSKMSERRILICILIQKLTLSRQVG